eukprot:4922820-Ditylum_brightwellii.AAC.1
MYQKGGNQQKLWDIYCGVLDNAACPRHGPEHTSGECKSNPFQKKGNRIIGIQRGTTLLKIKVKGEANKDQGP